MHFLLAFEADHGFAFPTLYLGGLRPWCAHPFLTFRFRTYYHERVFLIIDIIFESFIALDNFRAIAKDHFELSQINCYLAPRFRAFENVNFLLIDIILESMLDASSAVSVSAI